MIRTAVWQELAFCGALFAAVTLSGLNGQAQNTSAMTPYQSVMKTGNTNLTVSASPAAGFTATKVTCPAAHAAGCTIRVEVTTQFSMSCCMQGNFQMKVTIPGTGSQVWPSSVANVGMMGSGMMGYGDTFAHTFRFMKSGIPAGATQTVTIQFQTDAGSGTAGYRSAAIDAFLN